MRPALQSAAGAVGARDAAAAVPYASVFRELCDLEGAEYAAFAAFFPLLRTVRRGLTWWSAWCARLAELGRSYPSRVPQHVWMREALLPL